jgi:sarcosine oxidase subunit beta
MSSPKRRQGDSADAIVIGGGVVGAAAAYELSKAGMRTVLLERGAPNRESSGTTAGNIHVQAIHPLRPGQQVPADFTRFLPLQREASRLWETLESELDASVELRRGGGFMVAETPQQVEHLRSKREIEARVGVESYLLDGAAARAELPLLSTAVLAATYCPEDGYANPLKVTPAYLRSAQRRGVTIHCFTRVTSIQHQGDIYRVQSDDCAWLAPVVINASGPWLHKVASLAGIDLRMTPCALQMHATVRTQPLMQHLVQHIGEGLSVKQVAAGNILIGGGWPAGPLDLEGRSPISIPSLFGNLHLAQRILPFLGTLRVLRVWAGPLAATPDEIPVIGEVPGFPGFLVVGGTYGFTLAPLWGKVLCDLALGHSPRVDLAGLGPHRLLATSAPALPAGRGI